MDDKAERLHGQTGDRHGGSGNGRDRHRRRGTGAVPARWPMVFPPRPRSLQGGRGEPAAHRAWPSAQAAAGTSSPSTAAFVCRRSRPWRWRTRTRPSTWPVERWSWAACSWTRTSSWPRCAAPALSPGATIILVCSRERSASSGPATDHLVPSWLPASRAPCPSSKPEPPWRTSAAGTGPRRSSWPRRFLLHDSSDSTSTLRPSTRPGNVLPRPGSPTA